MTPTTSKARRLVVVLGWSLDDFISEFAEADTETLVETLQILEEPAGAPPTNASLNRLDSGIRSVRRELLARGSK